MADRTRQFAYKQIELTAADAAARARDRTAITEEEIYRAAKRRVQQWKPQMIFAYLWGTPSQTMYSAHNCVAGIGDKYDNPRRFLRSTAIGFLTADVTDALRKQGRFADSFTQRAG